ncbi:hypothetical protein DOM21_14800 [Bacteriovorax stolpii]|uniref:DNA adenine methylase n=1 Tax=Bacteriovorax stolpii TaxID=960 RepID=UPI0011574D88|nr:DNA adenine methylase [Bacteriovorax stolpii]QDK42695.1 hypothetical protein DOM21_14800 [Bacteriovorax stolpii]
MKDLHGKEVVQSEFLKNFPDTRYMGSKRKLLPDLHKIFSQLEFTSALDAFSGTSSVSYLLKSMGKAVDTNDYLRFNYYTAKAIIENSKYKLSDEEVNEIIKFNPDKDNFIEKEFSDLYYSKLECRWLDSAMANIQFITNPYKKAIALSALCRACIKKRPRGIFTYTGMRYDDGRKDLKIELADHFSEAVKMLNASVLKTNETCKAHNQDIMGFKKTNYDLIYLDPPYFSLKSDNEYSRRYHFLEGLVSYWDHVEINRSTKTKKFDRPDSLFTSKNTIVTAFEELFDRFEKSALVLSYSSNCFPDAATIKSLIKNSGREVELIKIDYVYSVGTHSHKKDNQSNKVKEYVFLGL